MATEKQIDAAIQAWVQGPGILTSDNAAQRKAFAHILDAAEAAREPGPMLTRDQLAQRLYDWCEDGRKHYPDRWKHLADCVLPMLAAQPTETVPVPAVEVTREQWDKARALPTWRDDNWDAMRVSINEVLSEDPRVLTAEQVHAALKRGAAGSNELLKQNHSVFRAPEKDLRIGSASLPQPAQPAEVEPEWLKDSVRKELHVGRRVFNRHAGVRGTVVEWPSSLPANGDRFAVQWESQSEVRIVGIETLGILLDDEPAQPAETVWTRPAAVDLAREYEAQLDRSGPKAQTGDVMFDAGVAVGLDKLGAPPGDITYKAGLERTCLERDKLRIELAEERAKLEAANKRIAKPTFMEDVYLKTLEDLKPAYDKMQDERDKLRTELAEARRLMNENADALEAANKRIVELQTDMQGKDATLTELRACMRNFGTLQNELQDRAWKAEVALAKLREACGQLPRTGPLETHPSTWERAACGAIERIRETVTRIDSSTAQHPAASVFVPTVPADPQHMPEALINDALAPIRAQLERHDRAFRVVLSWHNQTSVRFSELHLALNDKEG